MSSATPVICQVCGVSYAGADKSRCPNCGIETGGKEPDRFAGRIEKCYRFIERIGEGGMGVVYRGEPLTTATDLYSLGIVFYELLTGSHPYPADDSWALMNKHAGEELPPLPDDVPRPLARIVEEMTRKSADERSLSAAEIAEELDDFIKGNRNKGMRKRAMLFIIGEIVILAAILALVAAVSYAIGARHS